jgi:hypothetical protein
VGSEYFINSQELEDKVRQLLPSQGGAGAGFDLSASTQIIPIIDLTESAEGSNLRTDLQTSISFDTATVHAITSGTTTVINNTGYFRVRGNAFMKPASSGASTGNLPFKWILNDGTTDKIIFQFQSFVGGNQQIQNYSYDFIVKLEAGHSLSGSSGGSLCEAFGNSRQIADISGNLTNP